MKKVFAVIVLILFAVACVCGYFYSQRNRIVLEKLTQGVQLLSGAPAELTGVTLTSGSPFSIWKLHVDKMVLRNQGAYRFDKLASIENVEIEFHPVPLLSGKWRIKKLSAYLYRGYFQTNAQGVLNISQLPGIKMLTASAQGGAADYFYADHVELKYGKFYRVNDQSSPAEKKTYALEGKVDVYMKVNNPNLLVQAPVFMYLSQMNLGSFGLPRGKLQESIRQYVGQ